MVQVAVGSQTHAWGAAAAGQKVFHWLPILPSAQTIDSDFEGPDADAAALLEAETWEPDLGEHSKLRRKAVPVWFYAYARPRQHPCCPKPPRSPLLPAVEVDSTRSPRDASPYGDVISRLVGIYGSKELFMGEYRWGLSMLACNSSALAWLLCLNAWAPP